MSDAFESKFEEYLESDAYEKSEGLLFSAVRAAYKAGGGRRAGIPCRRWSCSLSSRNKCRPIEDSSKGPFPPKGGSGPFCVHTGGLLTPGFFC